MSGSRSTKRHLDDRSTLKELATLPNARLSNYPFSFVAWTSNTRRREYHGLQTYLSCGATAGFSSRVFGSEVIITGRDDGGISKCFAFIWARSTFTLIPKNHEWTILPLRWRLGEYYSVLGVELQVHRWSRMPYLPLT